MVHAIGWMAAASWSTQLVTWTCTIIVARLLAPSDFGVIAMANLFLGLDALVSEFGLGAAVIAMPELSEDQVSHLNTVSVVSGMVLFAFSCAVAYPLGEFFGVPQLPAVVIAMSATFAVTSLKTVPDALLQRELRFKLLAKIQAAQALSYAASTVAAAALGAQYWSLVIGCGGRRN